MREKKRSNSSRSSRPERRSGRGFEHGGQSRGYGHGRGDAGQSRGYGRGGERGLAASPENVIAGRNPVIEALRSGRSIEKIYVRHGAGGSIAKITAMAKEQGIVVEQADKEKMERLTGGSVMDQGVCAVVPAADYVTVDDILENAASKGEKPFIIILDGIEDPQNLGSIIRSAECAGAHGVIIPKNRAAGLTAAVDKASAGAVEYMPCARVVNISKTIDELKKKGVWVYACDFGGELYSDQDLTSPAAFVIGAEGKGVSRLVREKSDFVISLPMRGKIQSLNAANAATVIMYEVRRQRG